MDQVRSFVCRPRGVNSHWPSSKAWSPMVGPGVVASPTRSEPRSIRRMRDCTQCRRVLITLGWLCFAGGGGWRISVGCPSWVAGVRVTLWGLAALVCRASCGRADSCGRDSQESVRGLLRRLSKCWSCVAICSDTDEVIACWRWASWCVSTVANPLSTLARSWPTSCLTAWSCWASSGWACSILVMRASRAWTSGVGARAGKRVRAVAMGVGTMGLAWADGSLSCSGSSVWCAIWPCKNA